MICCIVWFLRRFLVFFSSGAPSRLSLSPPHDLILHEFGDTATHGVTYEPFDLDYLAPQTMHRAGTFAENEP